MPLIDVNRVGQYGIVGDLKDFTLPPNVWTSGQNVRFRNGRVEKFRGEQVVYDGATVAPYWMMPAATDDVLYLVYASLTAAGQWDGTTHSTITRSVGGAYSAEATKLWNGGVLNGIPVINNGVDVPQYWATIGSGTLENLTNWPSTHRCKFITPFKFFLVALNLTISGSDFPHRVLWSTIADPGTVPSSWDVTDATEDAGQQDLADVNSGVLEGALALGDVLVLYKSGSVWTMRYLGGNQIFGFYPTFGSFGAINGRCIVEIPPGRVAGQRQHLVATGDDLILHNLQQFRSILDPKLRNYLGATIDSDNYQRSFLVANPRYKEVWFCYPGSGESTCTLALVWNLEEDTVGVRDMPNATHGLATYIVDSASGLTWGTTGETWDSVTDIWNQPIFSAATRGLLLAKPSASDFLQVDQTQQFAGVNMTSYVERIGLALIGYDRQGQPQVDIDQRKLIKRIWPKMPSGGPVTIKAAVQEDIDAAVTYSAGMTFTPGSGQRWVDLETPLAGRLMGIRVESAADVSWEMEGYGMDIELLGVY